MNRQIIEVTDTETENILEQGLVVRPRLRHLPGRLHDEARRFVRNAGGYTNLRLNRKRHTKQLLMHAGSFGTVGALIGALIMLFIR